MQTVKNESELLSSEVMAEVSGTSAMSIFGPRPKVDRRKHRRTDLEMSDISVERWDGPKVGGRSFGQVLDLSASGIRVRTTQPDLRVGAQIRIRLRLPVYAGISPFVADDGTGAPSNEWCGWMTIVRVQKSSDTEFDIGGRLVDMRDIDRAMLGLYLSAQPLAA
jgi:PilZ domain